MSWVNSRYTSQESIFFLIPILYYVLSISKYDHMPN